MKKTKIDWADSSWNPVSGCLHGCEYCYARGIANRFSQGIENCINENVDRFTSKWLPEYEESIHCFTQQPSMRNKAGKIVKSPYPCGFAPTLHAYRLGELEHWTKPRTIFVCSMADLFGDWVPYEWIQKVFEACKAVPQHRYLFLTKNPDRYINLAKQGLLPMEENFWYGSSTPTTDHKFFWHRKMNTFVSIEPILEPFSGLLSDVVDAVKKTNWIIVGAETGNRKEKVVPEKSWIMELVYLARATNTPIFMKESLREIMGEDFIQQYPWEDRT